MIQIYLKYNTETPPKYPKSFTGKTCSSLLCYRFVSTTLAAQIPSGNAIANSQGLLHAETGFSYFGARYYDSDILTGWLSVDPMADKYPSLSPYAYCAWTRPTGADEHRLIEFNIANNPIRLVDPDGRMIVPNDDGWIVNHREKTITKVSDNGGNFAQIEYNNSGEIINTSFSSIDNFIQQYESLGYAVNRIENQYKNIGVDLEKKHL